MIKVLHNGSCSKSNAILEYLDENGVQFELKTVLKKLNQPISHIIRKEEKLYLEKFAGKNISEEEWLKILCENPSLIQRPIIIKGSVAMLGRPIENVKFFIEK